MKLSLQTFLVPHALLTMGLVAEANPYSPYSEDGPTTLTGFETGDRESYTLASVGELYETTGLLAEANPAGSRNFKKGLAMFTAQSCNALTEHATSSWWYYIISGLSF